LSCITTLPSQTAIFVVLSKVILSKCMIVGLEVGPVSFVAGSATTFVAGGPMAGLVTGSVTMLVAGSTIPFVADSTVTLVAAGSSARTLIAQAASAAANHRNRPTLLIKAGER